MPVPQELLKPKQEQAKQQLAELMQNPQINIPCQTDEEDSELAAHAGITPSILHGSIPEVQQFLHILLGGQALCCPHTAGRCTYVPFPFQTQKCMPGKKTLCTMQYTEYGCASYMEC
eukprot:82726-Pelagomonas_calceolata.AAC.3